MHPDKIRNVSNLSSEDRYEYFIRKVADTESVWLIHDNSKYVIVGDNDNNIAIPVWPELEFAELYLEDEWKDYSTISVEVHEFLEWLDQVHKENVMIAGFPLLDMTGIVVEAEEMKNHLLFELQQYE